MATTSKPKPITVRVEVKGLRETLRAFNRYGKVANGELRDAAQEHARSAVPVLSTAARGESKLAGAVAGKIRTPRDRVPVIAVGGTPRVAVSRKGRPPAAGEVVFGSEFGGGAKATTRQFPAYTRGGRWLFPTLGRLVPQLFRRYSKTLEALSIKWGAGG